MSERDDEVDDDEVDDDEVDDDEVDDDEVDDDEVGNDDDEVGNDDDEVGNDDDEEHDEPREVRVLAGKPTRWTRRLGTAAALAVLIASRLGIEGGAGTAAWIVALATVLSAVATWRLGRPRGRRAVVERDRVGLDGIGWVARRDVHEISHQMLLNGRTLMVLRDARGEALASIEAKDAASAEERLHLLGLRFDDVVRREGGSLASRTERIGLAATMAAGFFAVDRLLDESVPLASFVGIALSMAAATTRRQIVVGLDAVVIERVTRREVYPYSRIVRVDRDHPAGRALILDDGRVVPLDRRGQATPGTVWIAGWIERGLVRWREREAQHVPAGLAPGEGDVEAWKRQLDGLSSARDYRSAQVPPAALLRVAADPFASAEERVGAARVLCRVELDDAERENLERAALATAEPSVRDALEASARADLEGTERAMRRLRAR